MHTIRLYITVRRKAVNHVNNRMKRKGWRQQTTCRIVVTVARLIHRESVEPTTRLVTTVESWGTSPKYVVRLKFPKGKYGTSVRTYTKRLTERVSVTSTSGW